MSISQYIEIISKRLQSGISSEHTYRGDLETLIRTLVTNIEITNEPANVTDCGNPDYVITKGKIPVGYIEAKDIGKDLNSKSYKEQFTRYKKALDNLIITDYVWFQFFQNGELVHEIKIAEIENNSIKPIPEQFSKFENLIKDFCTHIGQTIKSPKKLAEMMAGKARLLQDILERAITSDEETQENTSLKGQYDTFKQILIHDLKPKGFADIYAQTLAYGMFAARLHDTTLNDFSRQEAAELIPKSNPFLRKLFGYVAGPDIDERIVTVVENLADVFRATDIKSLLKNFGKSTQTNDPIIHFYETFLAAYDAKLRKARGVWYTPEPVVNFIVRAVDSVLKTEFNLPQGLADTTKTTIKVKTDIANKNFKSGYKEIVKEVHKVQILDPATGTGTFLAEVVKFIYNKNFKSMQGAWSGYVEEHLIPRLNGFELLMASYAMAHLKLDMLLTETGYKSAKNQRLNIYLTNSLEEHHADTGTLFSNWLSSEANEANHIKRDTPVMCVIGNPPYSGVSSNKGQWISDLIEDYKYIDGVHFNERKHWLNDDYVKFLRYGQHYIEKNGSGVLAFINPHGFIDNPTFRGMRWNLLKTYDKIYTIDLHGNSNKKEISPDGSKDENVFDIKQGVSINIFLKTGKKKTNDLGKVFHYDLYGKRNKKYNFLWENRISNIKWLEIKPNKPNFTFKKVNLESQSNYIEGFKLSELFNSWTTGVQTSRDKVALSFTKNEAKKKIQDFCNEELSSEQIRGKYFTQTSPKYPAGDTRDWKLDEKRKDSTIEDLNDCIKNYTFRPFDNRKIIFSDNILSWSRLETSKHLFKDNFSFITARSNKKGVDHFFISRNPSDVKCGERTTGSIFCPLYLYPDSEDAMFSEEKRKPNLDLDIVNQIAKKIGLTFVPDHEIATLQTPRNDSTIFTPLDILDYIYAVLHSPTYREKYKEFLKIDFPRAPFPKNASIFKQLVALGSNLRNTHLLDIEYLENDFIQYPNNGDNVVSKKFGTKSFVINKNGHTERSLSANEDKQSVNKEEIATSQTPRNNESNNQGNNAYGKVYINETQYFDNVSKTAWQFYIGGYQPAQKWLKDRKERELKFEDIKHYQKIITALDETAKLMKEIEAIAIE